MDDQNKSLSNNCRECHAPVDAHQPRCNECGAEHPGADEEFYQQLRALQKRGALILRPILAIIFIGILYYLFK